VIKIDKIVDNVQYILEKYPETRGNDHLLYVKYIEEIHKCPFNKESFIKYQQSFEGISRARRRVQENHSELVDEVVSAKRREMEQQYIDYYSN
jgi:hypothetical protein